MKKWLLALPLFMFAAPAQALTWEQLVEWAETPTHYHSAPYHSHYHPHGHYYESPHRWCNQIVYKEEYVPGRPDYHGNWMPGHVNKWQETVKVPCRRLLRRRHYH